MLINHLDKIFVTSDTATLLKELEVAHPAAKIMTMAAQMQESEIGDGSNLVIVLIGELLAQAGQSAREEQCLLFSCACLLLSSYLQSFPLPSFPFLLLLCQLRSERCRGVAASPLLSLLSFAQVELLRAYSDAESN